MGRSDTYTYIKIGGTVKPILIGHHAERERERKRAKKGGKKIAVVGVGKQTGRVDVGGGGDSGDMWPSCGRCREENNSFQTGCEREKRKKGEIITHRATCKKNNTTSVYTNAPIRHLRNMGC